MRLAALLITAALFSPVSALADQQEDCALIAKMTTNNLEVLRDHLRSRQAITKELQLAGMDLPTMEGMAYQTRVLGVLNKHQAPSADHPLQLAGIAALKRLCPGA